MRFNLDAVAIKNNVDGDAAEPKGESASPLAVACGRYERIALRGVFSAIRSGLVVLDRADAIDRRNLVFRKGHAAKRITRSPSWICRRNNFHQRVLWLAWFARRFVSELFPPQLVSPAVDLPRTLFRILELAGRFDSPNDLPQLRSKFIGRVSRRGRLGDARMGPRLAVQRFWMEWARSRPSSLLAFDSSIRIFRGRWIVLRGCVYERHRGRSPDPFVRGSEKPSDAAAF
jgi:hypothetical protein